MLGGWMPRFELIAEAFRFGQPFKNKGAAAPTHFKLMQSKH
jgi:hypothetical protein